MWKDSCRHEDEGDKVQEEKEKRVYFIVPFHLFPLAFDPTRTGPDTFRHLFRTLVGQHPEDQPEQQP
jgi:hypothetical protein